MALDSFKTESSAMNTRKKVKNIELPEDGWRHYLRLNKCKIPKGILQDLEDNELAAIIKFSRSELSKPAPFGTKTLDPHSEEDKVVEKRQKVADNIEAIEEYLEERETSD